MRSGFIIRSTHTSLQVSVCSGYDFVPPDEHSDRLKHTQTTFDQLIRIAQPEPAELTNDRDQNISSSKP